MALLEKAAAAAPTPVDRFRAKLAIAQICAQIQQFAIARAQLETLEQLIERHHLTAWQPDICAEAYGALFTCLRAMNQGYDAPPEARVKEAQAFERLCQLDAALAFKLMMG
jgi:type VI secretion system protein VasJ